MCGNFWRRVVAGSSVAIVRGLGGGDRFRGRGDFFGFHVRDVGTFCRRPVMRRGGSWVMVRRGRSKRAGGRRRWFDVPEGGAAVGGEGAADSRRLWLERSPRRMVWGALTVQEQSECCTQSGGLSGRGERRHGREWRASRAHRLVIEQACVDGRRAVDRQSCADVGEYGEVDGVRFWEAVGGE